LDPNCWKRRRARWLAVLQQLGIEYQGDRRWLVVTTFPTALLEYYFAVCLCWWVEAIMPMIFAGLALMWPMH